MKTIFRFLAIITIGLSIFFYQNGLPEDLPFLHQEGQAIETQNTNQKEISQPEPLRVNTEWIAGNKNSAVLSAAGAVKFTNQERLNQNLSSLSVNEKLNASAKAKVEDMLRNQYFEHTSPDGTILSDLMERAGYEFILIGENLAYGDFKDDQSLISAWMDSPMHRANILNGEYIEIGVAVGHGMINGENTWLAVTHFGRGADLCPEIDKDLKAAIDQNKTRIDEITNDLNLTSGGAAVFLAYFKDFREVREYNKLIEETRIKIEEYNNQVVEFNNCIEE